MSLESHHLPWLVLHLVPGITGPRLQRLLAIRGTAESLSRCTPAELQALGWPTELAQRAMLAVRDPWRWLPELKTVANWAARPGNRLLTPADRDYPPIFMQLLADPPPVLYLRGDSALLQEPHLAVVGSRRPGTVNRHLARDWCSQLASAGLVVSSGLARGIDAAAHRGTLDGGGRTLAVMGSGLDNVYPAGHEDLVSDILAADGAVLSELPPETPPYAANFPRRNRLVAALAEAVLVVEAARRSGSLITARLAGEFGREVMAVPGHPHEEGSAGTNDLIRDGALLADHWQTVADFFPHLSDRSNEDTEVELTEPQARLYAAIGTAPTAVETLAAALHCDPVELYEPLLELELAGLVAAQGGSYVRLRGP